MSIKNITIPGIVSILLVLFALGCTNPASSFTTGESSSQEAELTGSDNALQSRAALLKAEYTIQNQWDSGFTAQVTITNSGSTAVEGWQVEWTYEGNQQITSSWSGDVKQSGKKVTVKNADFNKVISPQGSVSFGFQATYSGTNTIPALIINGNQQSSSSVSSSSSSSSTSTSSSSSSSSQAPVASYRPRVIVTTDGEVDDRSSMIRFLMYTCDFDVEGIVQVNSKYQKSGHSGENWIEKQLNAYAKVLPKLRVHNSNYPSANFLRNLVRVGNENKDDLYKAPSKMKTKDTAGEKLIIERLLANDPRPLHVLSWGGANTTASALWRLKNYYSASDFKKAVSKIRIYCIWYQDGGGQWIEDNIKGALINEAYKWDDIWDYQSHVGPSPAEVKKYMSPEWLTKNVKKNHGPLGALTPQARVSEGDTPSFLHLINNGLDAHVDYTLGGWGGRSALDPDDKGAKPNHLTDKHLKDDGDPNKMFWRWIIDAENDFAARMDWGVTSSFSGANHAPVANVKGGNYQTVSPGQKVTLDGSGTKDPDNDSLTYKWWQYHDADSAKTKLKISNSTRQKGASFTVPNEPGKELHVILEVKDSGKPTLTGYQRIIFTIK